MKKGKGSNKCFKKWEDNNKEEKIKTYPKCPLIKCHKVLSN